ncbi:MAG: hypothetical protein RIS76_132, partial [Verrucomicrobiota bacterium]
GSVATCTDCLGDGFKLGGGAFAAKVQMRHVRQTN